MISTQERLRFFQAHIDAATLIIARTRNNQGFKVLQFLRKYGCIISPKESGGFQCDAAHARYFQGTIMPRVWLYAYHSSELQLLSAGCITELGLDDPRQVATYYGANNFLVMYTEQRHSPFFWGILLLHEAAHAYADQTKRLKHTRRGWPHERDVQTFTNEIWIAYGGDPYLDLLQDYRARIQAHYDSLQQPIGTKPFPDLSYEWQLDHLFGTAAIGREHHRRMRELTIQAIFSLLEAEGGNWQQRQEQFLELF
jgi:hypothetical protein